MAAPKAGRYLELGVAPGYCGLEGLSSAVPVKVGLSLADYYELNTGTAAAPVFVDNTFGYFSIAGLVTVPLGGTTELRRLEPARRRGVSRRSATPPKRFNGGDGSRVIGSVGIGFSY